MNIRYLWNILRNWKIGFRLWKCSKYCMRLGMFGQRGHYVWKSYAQLYLFTMPCAAVVSIMLPFPYISLCWEWLLVKYNVSGERWMHRSRNRYAQGKNICTCKGINEIVKCKTSAFNLTHRPICHPDIKSNWLVVLPRMYFKNREVGASKKVAKQN